MGGPYNVDSFIFPKKGPNTQSEEDEIVSKHNEYRAKVTDATDMMKMVWDDELGMLARKWAENCDYRHEDNIKRFVPGTISLPLFLCLSLSRSLILSLSHAFYTYYYYKKIS